MSDEDNKLVHTFFRNIEKQQNSQPSHDDFIRGLFERKQHSGRVCSDEIPSVQPLTDEEYPIWKWWDEDKKCWIFKPRLTDQDWVDYNKWKADNDS